MNHFAITSTYPLPFFLLLTVPPLRAVGAPRRSSIELALLREVVDGRGGAACGVGPPGPGGRLLVLATAAAAPAAEALDTDRGGIPFKDPGAGPLVLTPVEGRLSGVVPNCDIDSGRCNPPGGGGATEDALLPTLTDRLCGPGPLGGGGVARAEAIALLGSFLLTHFLSSGS